MMQPADDNDWPALFGDTYEFVLADAAPLDPVLDTLRRIYTLERPTADPPAGPWRITRGRQSFEPLAAICPSPIDPKRFPLLLMSQSWDDALEVLYTIHAAHPITALRCQGIDLDPATVLVRPEHFPFA